MVFSTGYQSVIAQTPHLRPQPTVDLDRPAAGAGFLCDDDVHHGPLDGIFIGSR
jgi:hypothetical protein